MQRPRTPILEEHARPIQRAQQPKNHIHQINPHGILHALDPSIAFGILVDEHLPKDAEERRPENTNPSHTKQISHTNSLTFPKPYLSPGVRDLFLEDLQEHNIPPKNQMRLHKRHHVHQRRDRGQGADDYRVYVVAVCVLVR